MPHKHPDTASPNGGDPPVRIAKAIARAGLASRRDAEAWIAAGRVAVNGETIATPAITVTPQDRITVDGAPLPQRERTRLFLYYKPVGLVTTTADPQGRPTIFSGLPKNLPRLITVGRLDIATEGLLLLTNDGGLARVLELPATGWVRRYRVRAHGRVEPAALARLREGITIDGIHYGPIEATLDRDQGANVWLTVAIREGKNREVRNVVEALGLQANRLIRVSFGPFQLGDMRDGEVVEVRTRVLRDQLGERIADEAGCDFSAPIIVREEVEERAPPRERITREKRVERVTRDRHDARPARREDRPRRGEDARPPREDRPRRREDGRPSREDRPARRRDEGDRREGPRDGRPPRRERDAGVQPRSQQNERFRRPRRDDRDLAEKPAGRPRRGHAWRSDDAPLGRHYRGAGSKAREFPDAAERPKRAGLIADRKGRRVLVERFGEKPAAPRPAREAGGRGSPRRSSSASPLEGEGGAKRRDGGHPRARFSKSAMLPASKSRSERFASGPRRDDKPSGHRGKPGAGGGRPGGHRGRDGDRPTRPAGKPSGYGGKHPPGRSGKPGPRDRPRGAGPRPSRPGSPKRK